ncbi:MAG: aldo/keto reductase [Flexistipes sinusarabici]|uniref:Aldo/keto reductase n=1 Tax=Flexistipes sinusarabici TaxID=2352 RepID=A0A5D0MQE4_FLESI|nr:aldo/keto reductase [Flexistipes sinusarabici]TYB33903.1 MAG: aldo/keto reductase [Flexistipes sinusarabici]
METTKIAKTDIEMSRVGLGTWAIGGWMWGGTDEKLSVETIHKALDSGVNMVDTAPVYGFGTSESIVGKALKEYGKRDKIVLATKAGLEWNDDGVFRNSSKERLEKEIDDSLKRLQTDYIDIYQIHWPDKLVSFDETAEFLNKLVEKGKIRAIGVSNYSTEQMDEFRKTAPIHTSQPPYNMFERQIEDDILPYCLENNIVPITYGAICRGLLSGKMTEDKTFEGDDLRKIDPKFKGDRFKQYLSAVDKLDKFARENYGKTVMNLAIRWVLDKTKIGTALLGARKPHQVENIANIYGWHIDKSGMNEIDKILSEEIKDPVGPEFMAPPHRK